MSLAAQRSPVAAAAGGMVVPAVVYLVDNAGGRQSIVATVLASVVLTRRSG